MTREHDEVKTKKKKQYGVVFCCVSGLPLDESFYEICQPLQELVLQVFEVCVFVFLLAPNGLRLEFVAVAALCL